MGKAAPVEVDMFVEAAPGQVYDLVADINRMGSWSSECRGMRWKRGAGSPQVGARFRGSNRNGWHRWRTSGVFVQADPGRRLAWNTSFLGLPMSRWTYEFEAKDGGCLVTERWEDRQIFLSRPWIVGWLVTGVRHRGDRNAETMTTTLERLRSTAENGAARAR